MKASKTRKHPISEGNVKALLGFSIVALAFILLIFFNTKKDELVDADLIKQISMLITIGLGLLIVVWYLATKPAGRKK